MIGDKKNNVKNDLVKEEQERQERRKQIQYLIEDNEARERKIEQGKIQIMMMEKMLEEARKK